MTRATQEQFKPGIGLQQTQSLAIINAGSISSRKLEMNSSPMYPGGEERMAPQSLKDAVDHHDYYHGSLDEI